MSEKQLKQTTHVINGHAVRTVVMDDTHYVAMKDFCEYVQTVVGKIVELNQRQQEHMAAISTTLDVFYDVLSEKYPQLKEELMKASAQRSRLV